MIEPALVTGSDGQDMLLIYMMIEGEMQPNYIEVSVKCMGHLAVDASERGRQYLERKMG